ncbi:hypothetical protein FDP41_008735 [Naegleria fowleri]|uniref:Deoxynucleoside kinase domain-containing protein n=1 Tax=Naegleria fowleri TaxID=5763 RepID=A0A6A5BEY8_NAEFO|nr:uncharacterized protein FDP41_008735 [Naegleria fowleri]KAF0973071.1 hypothetical protein FDP41_008735 [Naegleria fowleri]CAG4713176.1 unnamed protein product [Naegleria fowleri]
MMKQDILSSSIDNQFLNDQVFIGTTLAKALAEKLGIGVHYEPVIDNEYLADFYSDMKAYSFRLQVYLLNRRFEQHQKIIWGSNGGIQDRTIYEDTIFAKVLMETGMMEKRDYDTYVSLFRNMSKFMKHNTMIIHLDVSPEKSLERIKLRGRECESGITLEYLQRLHAGYEEWLTKISKIIPVIKVNWSEFRSLEDVLDEVLKAYNQIHNIQHVTWQQEDKETSKQ